MAACTKNSSWNYEDILFHLQEVVSLLQLLHVMFGFIPLKLMLVMRVVFWNWLLHDPEAAEFVCFLTFNFEVNTMCTCRLVQHEVDLTLYSLARFIEWLLCLDLACAFRELPAWVIKHLHSSYLL